MLEGSPLSADNDGCNDDKCDTSGPLALRTSLHGNTGLCFINSRCKEVKIPLNAGFLN